MKTMCNTTVLVNFASIGYVQIVRDLFGKIAIPTEVQSEIRAGIEEGYIYLRSVEEAFMPPATAGWIQLVSMHDHELLRYAEMPKGLHAGEAACLTIASHRNWLFLTDDRAARAEARRRGVQISGSIGCLVLGVERGLFSVTEANQHLAAMIAQGYHSPISDLASVIRCEPEG